MERCRRLRGGEWRRCCVGVSVVLCYAMLCYAVLSYAVLSYAVLCCAILCCAIICHPLPCCAVQCYAMLSTLHPLTPRTQRRRRLRLRHGQGARAATATLRSGHLAGAAVGSQRAVPVRRVLARDDHAALEVRDVPCRRLDAALSANAAAEAHLLPLAPSRGVERQGQERQGQGQGQGREGKVRAVVDRGQGEGGGGGEE